MRISDWSSDVCSSDLDGDGRGRLRGVDEVVAGRGHDDAAGTGERAVVQVGQGAGAGQPAAGFTDPGRSPDPPGVARRQGRAGRVLQQSGSDQVDVVAGRSEEHTSELQSLKRLSYAVVCLK